MRIAAKVGLKAGKAPSLLRVVESADDGMNALQRDVLYTRIRHLEQQYSLGWLVLQETMHVHGIIECLSDDELNGLLTTLGRAVEAIYDGVPFVEIGLVRGVSCNWVA